MLSEERGWRETRRLPHFVYESDFGGEVKRRLFYIHKTNQE